MFNLNEQEVKYIKNSEQSQSQYIVEIQQFSHATHPYWRDWRKGNSFKATMKDSEGCRVLWYVCKTNIIQ